MVMGWRGWWDEGGDGRDRVDRGNKVDVVNSTGGTELKGSEGGGNRWRKREQAMEKKVRREKKCIQSGTIERPTREDKAAQPLMLEGWDEHKDIHKLIRLVGHNMAQQDVANWTGFWKQRDSKEVDKSVAKWDLSRSWQISLRRVGVWKWLIASRTKSNPSSSLLWKICQISQNLWKQFQVVVSLYH